MKVSLDWLNDYVQIDRPPGEVAEILSNLGFPTEGVEYPDGDTVIDMEVTSNRGDCLSHIGIARELAAAMGKTLKLPEVKLPQADEDVCSYVDVSIDQPQLCGRYTARVILDVKIGPSPDWMTKRLEALGLRSVNNVVDATNYAMLETGQPPHTFDYHKITGGRIIVRKAVQGERLVSIDETKCELDTEMLVIADEKSPVALAGVMGGLDSEISESTTAILLEDAQFDPVTVRQTSRKLAISSESSFRFERFVDTELIDWASQRTAQLICQVAGGKVARGVVDVYPGKSSQQTVGMRSSRLNKLLGIEVRKDEVLKIFSGLGFEPQAKEDDLIVSTVPTWRHDIYREVDLIEEAARSHGYDNIPTERKINIEVKPADKREKLSWLLRAYLNGCGFYETINVTFVDPKVAELFEEDGQQGSLSVKDQFKKATNLLRQNLLGSLLGVVKSNYYAKNIPCMVFELADTFQCHPDKNQDTLPIEKTRLELVADSDFRRFRGVIDGLLKCVKRDISITFKPIQLPWADAGAEILTDEQIVGTCGVVSEKVRSEFDLAEVDVCGASLDFESLLAIGGETTMVKAIPRFPAITRDLSLILDEKIRWADIVGAVESKAVPELEDVGFVGIYRGKPIPADKKSLTLSLRFRDEDGTLKHEIVDVFQKEIVGALTDKLGAELRTL